LLASINTVVVAWLEASIATEFSGFNTFLSGLAEDEWIAASVARDVIVIAVGEAWFARWDQASLSYLVPVVSLRAAF